MNDKPVILVVDDDPRIADALIHLLRSSGFRAIAAGDALEAVALARASKPEAILMDVMLPGMEGSVAAALLKDSESLKDTPIILASALPEEELQLR
ncbi:MAG TPA: response regulator, partial [Planctomycetota bacterium]|nr:response regulator [Planctomycetota bacterium]